MADLSEKELSHLDRALSAAETHLEPLLLRRSAAEVEALFLQHVQAHLEAELDYVETGEPSSFEAGSQRIVKLRQKFMRRLSDGAWMVRCRLQDPSDC